MNPGLVGETSAVESSTAAFVVDTEELQMLYCFCYSCFMEQNESRGRSRDEGSVVSSSLREPDTLLQHVCKYVSITL